MNCSQWEERVALYAGGDLGPADASAVESHLTDCSGCQLLLSGLRQSLALIQDAHAEPIDEAHFAAVRARVLSDLEHGSARRWRFAWTYALAAAAILVLVALWPHPELRLALPLPSTPAAPAIAKVELPQPAPLPRVVVRRPRVEVASGPVVVKILTNDPDVVIYWISGTKGE